MTTAEFQNLIETIELATGCPIDRDPMRGAKRTQIYFDLLKDIPLAALRTGVERLLAERKWASFPQSAEIRELAVASMHGEVQAMTWEEAWEMAGKTVRKFSERKQVEGLASLPPTVAGALRAFGWQRMCDMRPDEIGTAVAQFRDIFNNLALREQKLKMLPAGAKAALDAAKMQALPEARMKILAKIGVEK